MNVETRALVVVTLQRAVLTTSVLSLYETVVAFHVGALPTSILGPIVGGQALFAAAGCAWLVALRWWRPSLSFADTFSFAVFLVAPSLVFAVRGGGEEAPPVPPDWLPWLRMGALVLVVLAVLVLGYRRRNADTLLSSSSFLLLVGLSSLVTVGSFAARTLDVRHADPIVSQNAIVPLGGTLLVLLIAGGLLRMGRGTCASVSAAAGVMLGGALLCAVADRTRLDPVRTSARAPASASVPAVRGVLLITLDTLRRDHMATYGYARDTTQRLKEFGERSIVFDNAYASSSFTPSSHGSLFTGLLPSEHGAHCDAEPSHRRGRIAFPIRPGLSSLAARFALQGYATAGIAANYGGLALWTGLGQGFEEYSATLRREYRYFPLFMPLKAWSTGRSLRIEDMRAAWTAPDITAAAERWLETHGSAPFFLFLNYMEAHEYWSTWGSADRPTFGSPGRRGRQQLIDSYDEHIQRMDRSVGELLDWMSSRGMLESTLVVVTSDHGEYFGEHGLWQHAHDIHEPVLRVPLLVKLAGPTRPTRVNARLNHQDMFSFVLRAAGGISQDELLASLPDSATPRVMAEGWTWAGIRRTFPERFPWSKTRAIYGGSWKLMQRIGAPPELYDLVRDPQETDDVFKRDPAAAERVAAELTSRLPALTDDDPVSLDSPGPNHEALERLRGLGYVGP